MKLYTKIMLKFKHYVSTTYGVSSNYYGGENESLARTGQDNKFSGNMCRDISCLIIKQIEEQQLEVIYTEELTKLLEQCTVVVFVNDADLATDEKTPKQAADKMQWMINLYNRLYGATGEVIESEKSKLYAW